MDKTENPFLRTLRLPVKNSPILLIVGISLHIVCLFLPWITGFTLIIKLILSLLIATSLSYYYYQMVFYKGDKRVCELFLSSEDNWQLKIANGAVYQARLGGDLFVHPWLTLFSLTFENKRKYFIFTPEILDADQFRRLRVRLRFKLNDVVN